MQTRHAAPDEEFASFAEFYQNSVYAAFPQEHRSGGSFGVSIFKVEQEPIDFVDAAVTDLVFTRTENDIGDVLFDLGNGTSVSEGRTGMLTYYPAKTEARTRVEVPHTLTVLAIKHRNIAEMMAMEGGDVSCFESLSAKMSGNAAASLIMDRIWQASADVGLTANLYLDGLTLQFLAVLAGNACLSPLGVDHIENARISRAIDYLEAHLSEPMTVSELASIAALSPSQFARVFKATTGEAVWTFVQRRRIERARDLLRHTTTPISQIAFDCGFSSQNHMSNLFRQHLGATPGEVRRSP